MEVKKSLNRFLSIFFIVAMGVAFFSGIQSSAPDMRATGDYYFDENKLMDIKVLGTLGIAQSDLDAISAIEGVQRAVGSYMEDVYCGEGEIQEVLHVEAMTEGINELSCEEGQVPAQPGECLLDAVYAQEHGYRVGDTLRIEVSSEEDTALRRTEFRVSGIGNSPCYVAYERGSTTLGSGSVEGFVYVLPEEFDSEVYHVAYVQAAGAREEVAYTDGYRNLVDAVFARIEDIGDVRCEIRYDEVMAEAQEKIDDAKQEVADGKQEVADAKQELADGKKEAESELAEAESELTEGESELADGKEQLEDSKKELEDGEQELADGEAELAKNEDKLADARVQIADAISQLEQGEKEYRSGLSKYREEEKSAKKQLDDAQAQLDAGKTQLADGRKQYEEQLALLEASEQQLDQAEAVLNASQKEYDAGAAQLAAGQRQYESGAAQLAAGWQQYEEQAAQLAAGRKQYEAGAAQLAAGRQQYEAGAAQLAGAWADYESGVEQYRAAESQYQQAEQAVAGLERAYGAKVQEIAALEQESRDAAAEQAACEQRAAAIPAEISQKKAEQEAAENALGAAQGRLGAAQAEVTAAQGRLATAQTGLTNAQSALANAQAALDSANAALAEINNDPAATEEQRKQAAAAVESARAARDAAERDVKTAETSVNNEEAAVAGAQAAAEAAQKEADRAASDAATAAAAVAALEAERDALPGKIQAAKDRAARASSDAEKKTQELPGDQVVIDARKGELAQSRAQLDAQAAALAGSKAQLDAQTEILAGTEAELSRQEKVLAGTGAQLAEGEAALAAAKAQLDGTEAQLAAAKSELDANSAALAAAKAQLESGWAELNAGKAQTASGREQLAAAARELEENEAKLTASQEQVDQGRKELKDAKGQLAAARRKLDTGWAELNASRSQLADGESQLADGRTELADARRKLADGRQQIADAQKEIAENEQKLADGWADYEKGRQEAEDEIAEGEQKIRDAEEELADAEQKIADAEKELADLKYPKWYVYDRNELPDNAGFGDNADRLTNIAKVFPVIFFLVAALISLTTMTRMVEEERTQIGTMKALGYSKKDIAFKYLKYAFYATMGGSVFGVLVGEKILPWVIVNAYGILYQYLPKIVIPYDWGYGAIATGAALFCTMAATLSACFRELGAVPAQLMRPPTPKEGKRVLLEYLPFLWKRMSFTWKSTVRNLMRYKKRFLMTVIGIGGCMGLLLVGYGLRDSIMDVAVLQFEELQLYDAMVVCDTDLPKRESDEVAESLAGDSRVAAQKRFCMQKEEVKDAANERKEWTVYLYVPENLEDLDAFFCFRDRSTLEQYELTDEGVIVTEKIAKEFGVKAGDVLTLKTDEETVEFPVTAVCENYLNHYIYVTPALYEKAYGEAPEFNSVFYRTDGGEGHAQEIGREQLKKDVVLNVTYTKSLKDQLDNMLGALDIVMVVLIISAGMLAFVVLYNLNNININERKRELATLKVLGFFDGEVASYVYRENVLLTVIGAMLGIFIGKYLHLFIIQTVEVDMCMFGRTIKPWSYVIGTLFTFGFSIIVNFVMYYKLKRIDMVESLKSVE